MPNKFVDDNLQDQPIRLAWYPEYISLITTEMTFMCVSGKVGATGENTMNWSVHINGDPNLSLETEKIERQFLIKWKGWSHINNTWESESSLGRLNSFLNSNFSTFRHFIVLF